MREHGTHACFVWGPESGAGKGCRCDPCRAANTAYGRERSARIAPAYVGASVVRDHIRMLQDHGLGLKTIAKQAGVSTGAVSKIMHGNYRGRPPSKRVRVETRDKILGVMPSDAADNARVPAARTWETIGTLLERGWTKAAISRAIGQDGRALQLARTEIHARHARAIDALLDAPVPPRRSRYGLHEVEQPAKPAPSAQIPGVRPPTVHISDAAWRERSACRLPNVPAWIFFPGRGDLETLGAALAVCDSCPVKADCLDDNIREQFGVWGGTSENQRREIRRERGIDDEEEQAA